MFPTIIFAQPKIEDIVWVGKNKEYLHIIKKEAAFCKGNHVQEFKVVKYVQNNYVIFSCEHVSGYLEQKYNIVKFTQDNLILEPVGKDIFKLSKPNENNQYVFTNSLNGFTFVKLHFSTSMVDTTLGIKISITLDIDSARKSRVKIHDDFMNETNIVTTSMSKNEYKRFVQILSAFDLSSLSEDFGNTIQDITKFDAKPLRISKDIVFYGNQGRSECSNSVFEVKYNDQITKCKGCSLVPFYYPALKDFLLSYIASKSAQSGRNPSILY